MIDDAPEIAALHTRCGEGKLCVVAGVPPPGGCDQNETRGSHDDDGFFRKPFHANKRNQIGSFLNFRIFLSPSK